ncbi:MAG: selenoprotein TsoY [Patescibacteria group bacterium]
MKDNRYSPLLYLSALGAGGIAVAFFAVINYTFDHGEGLANISQVGLENLGFWKFWVFKIFEVGMIVFSLIHLFLTLYLLPGLIRFIRNDGFKDFINDPLRNAAIVAPLISLIMSINVLLSVVRFFVPYLYDNLQLFMLPGLVVWGVIYVIVMVVEIWLLKISFTNGFDINKINFGWLLHPFVLGMLTVTGTGIAAMAKDYGIATAATVMTFMSGSMGLFLLLVKIVALFKSHFAATGLPEKQFLPSFLIVIPNITLYAISFFRLAHYFERHQGSHVHAFQQVVVLSAWLFESWYLIFGLVLLVEYFKKYFNRDFTVSQWGLVCPFVAYVVLGAFVYKMFLPYQLVFGFLIVMTGVILFLFYNLMSKQFACWSQKSKVLNCE